jgi:methyl-accepting chemotaxis protein
MRADFFRAPHPFVADFRPSAMKTWTIAQRLTGGFLVLILLVCLQAASSVFGLHRINQHATRIVGRNLPGITLSHHLEEQVLTLRVLNLRHLLSVDAAEMDQIDRTSAAVFADIFQTLQSSAATTLVVDDPQIFALVEPALRHYQEVNRQMRELSRHHQKEDAKHLLAQAGNPAFDAFEKSVLTVVGDQEQAADLSVASIARTLTFNQTFVGIMTGAAILFAFGTAIFITRSVNRVIHSAADGLSDASARVGSASNQVASASQSLARGASSQAASLEETSAALEEIGGMTKRNAENAANAKIIARDTRAAADQGTREMDDMVTAMGAIKSSSNNIAKIIKTIDEIAFQTNILALNAAVEAARAGEAGMGFAVVADEVRNLALRAAQAARETAERIDDSIQKSGRGADISGHVAATLQGIAAKARTVDELIAEIATASNEQTHGVDQVNATLLQMDQITQSNAANADQTASAAEELRLQAETMHGNVDNLMNLIGRGVGVHSSRPTPPIPAAAPRPGRRPAAAPASGNGRHHPDFNFEEN